MEIHSYLGSLNPLRNSIAMGAVQLGWPWLGHLMHHDAT
jgi:hypothetical protein